MKNIKFSFFIILNLVMLIACKTTSGSKLLDMTQIVDNTFQTTIVNNSLFTVKIDEKIIKKSESIKNSFPLRKSQLYDGWFVNYTIPLSDDIFYLHTEKVAITNNQTTVLIESPIKDNIRDVYIVVKNTSKQSVRLTDGSITVFPCCLKGRVNTQYDEKEYNIAPSKVAAYEISKEDEIKRGRVFVSQGNKNYPILENTVLKRGYVYTFEFNGNEIIKTDECPLLKVGEPLWEIEDESLIIERVITKGSVAYAIGRKKTIDIDGNHYYCPYLSCFDSSTGVIKWEKIEDTTEGSMYDSIILENGNIFIVGQGIVDENNVGMMWLYSPQGVLLYVKNSLEYIGFNAISLGSSESALVTGFDEEGIAFVKVSLNQNMPKCKSFLIQLPQKDFMSSAIPFYNQNSKTQFLFCNLLDEEGRNLPLKLYKFKQEENVAEVLLQEKISSISSVVQTSSGILYVGGESLSSEKSEAIILKIDEENIELIYKDGKPFSYIASLHLNEESKELIASGVCEAKENSGLQGIPFISSIDLTSGKEVWRHEYKEIKYQLLRSFAPCLDYGFVASFSSILPSGNDYESSTILRLTATGKSILENE